MNLERSTLDLIERQLRSKKIDATRAKSIAQHVLNTLKENMTLDEIYRVVPQLDAEFEELIHVSLPVIQEYDAKLKQIVVPHVHKLIETGQINQANTILGQAKRREFPVTNHE